jgi:hypothetical protein
MGPRAAVDNLREERRPWTQPGIEILSLIRDAQPGRYIDWDVSIFTNFYD